MFVSAAMLSRYAASAIAPGTLQKVFTACDFGDARRLFLPSLLRSGIHGQALCPSAGVKLNMHWCESVKGLDSGGLCKAAALQLCFFAAQSIGAERATVVLLQSSLSGNARYPEALFAPMRIL